MADNLSNYNLENLAKRVEGGSDSDGQKAEPILIAKSMIELQNSIIALQRQIPMTGSEIRTTMDRSIGKLSNSINELKEEIKKYSESSNKHATAIKLLTGGLVFVGLLQLILIFLINKNLI